MISDHICMYIIPALTTVPVHCTYFLLFIWWMKEKIRRTRKRRKNRHTWIEDGNETFATNSNYTWPCCVGSIGSPCAGFHMVPWNSCAAFNLIIYHFHHAYCILFNASQSIPIQWMNAISHGWALHFVHWCIWIFHEISRWSFHWIVCFVYTFWQSKMPSFILHYLKIVPSTIQLNTNGNVYMVFKISFLLLLSFLWNGNFLLLNIHYKETNKHIQYTYTCHEGSRVTLWFANWNE